ncbi:hypothetical protein MJO29_010088 [Puccinia striiformis f. sp. tritici]|nr:hypothetical protein MJO29_010088 [Puccinia striiformis f. sp. tritici]
MDSHPHPSLARGNAAGPNLFDHETNTKPVIANTSGSSTSIENATQSPSAAHSHYDHHHHYSHHQFIDSSPVYHHPLRTVTPNSAEGTNKNVDPQPQSKSSTPTDPQQTPSRPNQVSTSDWSVTGIDLLTESHPPPVHRPFSANASLEGSAAREQPPTYSSTGTGDPSPMATSTARRSSSNANVYPSPDQTKLMTSALANPSATSSLSYYQHHPGQHTTGLAGVAANDCSGFDVRPMYGTQDSRQTPGQNPTQPRHESQTPNHTRVPSSQEMRGSLYTPATGAHYSSIDSGIISNHYSHLATPLTPQSGTRRSASSGAGFSPYPDVSAQVPLGANSYGQHHHAHRPDGPMLSGWPTSVDSVRDLASPYSRPGRTPSGPLTGHHTPASTPFPHSLRNGQLINSTHYPGGTNAARHHQPGTMQYNAQGRPLAYMFVFQKGVSPHDELGLRAFDRPSALQIHERSHTGERPFPCPWNGCVKRFTTHGNMVKHSRVCPFREPDE